MKKYAILSAALLILTTNLALSQGVKAKDKSHPSMTSAWFSKQTAFQCGNHNVAINTACFDKEKNLPYCFNQTVNFIRIGGDADSSTNFLYPFKNGNQELIVNASCATHRNASYVVLKSTNFGNCEICEWIDVFSESGGYLGSTKGMYDSSNFPHKLLLPDLENVISNALNSDNDHSEGVRISRSR